MNDCPPLILGTCKKCHCAIDATKAAVTVAYDDARPSDNWHKACAPVEYGGPERMGNDHGAD